jgi:membrane protease YdiL (CAAX protease family)
MLMNGNARDNGLRHEYRLDSGRKAQLFEVSVFLLLIIPSMVQSFLVVEQGAPSFTVTAWATILRDLGLVALVAYFLWTNEQSADRIGWTFRNVRTEIGIGFALFIPFFVGIGLVESALHAAGFAAPPAPRPEFLTPETLPQYLLAMLLVALVAVAEEIIFRGYLILRFVGLGATPAGAVALSAFIFSLGHGYEGSVGVITVGVAGFGLGMIYLWRQSLVSPIILHFLLNFVGVILAPLLRTSGGGSA